MKIVSVQTENVRQFQGIQEIEFSTDEHRNVTLVHGQNTTGKTTLLNAIKWCFYGSFLKGFDDPERLVSDQKVGSEYGVTVVFSHDNKHYTVRRTSKAGLSDARLSVLVQHGSGRQVPHAEPQLLINQILPESLSPFFFFAGEMITDGLGAFKTNQNTTNAIRAVLGFTVAENAIADLSFILKRKNSELAALSKGTDLGNISSTLIERTDRLELIETQLGEATAVFKIYDDRKKELSSILRNHETSSSLQQKRDRVEKSLLNAEEQHRRARRAWRQLISEQGHTVFWQPIAKAALSFIDDAVTKRRIPSPYDKTFVSDLLNDKVCVCGRELLPGTNAFKCVNGLINNATDEQTMRRALTVRGAGETITKLFDVTRRAFIQNREMLQAATETVETLEQERARIRELMLKHQEKNIASLEEEMARVDADLVKFKVKVARYSEDIETERTEIAELKKQRDRIQAASPQVEAVKRSINILSTLLEKVKIELERAEKSGIDQISEALNNVVGNSTRRKYIAEVSSDYTVSLYEGTDDKHKRQVTVLAGGERRLINLCFVSALVKVCRDRQNEISKLLVPGAVAPLIVDAPFGELDPKYQALAVATMRDQCDQLVLLLSETHRTKEVDDAVRRYIGKEWILVASKTSPAGKAADVDITIAGRVYRVFHYEQAADKTEFLRVEAN
jgi:DNA sulfur modification protein DndD